MGWWVVGRASCVVGHVLWVVGPVCLKIKERYTLAPSVLSPNLQLPAHELIFPNAF